VLKCLNSARTAIPESFVGLLSLMVEIFHLKNGTLISCTKSRAENGVRSVTLNACSSGTALNFCLKICVLSTYTWYNIHPGTVSCKLKMVTQKLFLKLAHFKWSDPTSLSLYHDTRTFL